MVIYIFKLQKCHSHVFLSKIIDLVSTDFLPFPDNIFKLRPYNYYYFSPDTIFAEDDPWENVQSEGEESDVVPWSWASPEWNAEDEGAVSSSMEDEFEPKLSSEEDNEIDPDAAVLLLEEMLAEEEEKERQEEEQKQLLEMVLGKNYCIFVSSKTRIVYTFVTQHFFFREHDL